MLTPKSRGEGEHSKHNKKKKAPQIALAVLLFSTPVCMAQAATSSFGIASELQPRQEQLQKGLVLPVHNYPNQKNQTRFASATPIITETESEVSALETTLAQYKTKLATLPTKAQNPELQAELDTAIANLKAKITNLEAKIKQLKLDIINYNSAKSALQNAIDNYTVAQQRTISSKADETQKSTELDTAKANLAQAKSVADASLTNLNIVKQDVLDKTQALSSADEALTNQINITNNALSELNTAQINTSNKAQALLEAQQNYDTLLIPDPTWTAPTYWKENIRLVLVETTTTTQSANILPALDHTVWSGAGTGYQGSRPTINSGVAKFSYMWQGVSYTGQTNSPANTTLTLSVDVRNMDANRGIQDNYKIELITYNSNGQQNGYAIYNSPQGWHEWTSRTVSVVPTSDVASYKVILSAIDGGYWAGNYGPEMKNPTLSATITTTVITYEEEIYYTEEPVLVEGTIDVAIDEGHTKTFTAPEGATFISSSLRYEAKQRPECGIDIQPNLNGTSITISASNGVWGDPCGGWYKHIVGTITYKGQPTAPLIHDPALLPPLQEAQASYDEALTFQETKSVAYAIELDKRVKANTLKENAENDLSYAITLKSDAQETYDSKQLLLSQAQADVDVATQNLATSEQEVAEAEAQEVIALDAKTEAEASLQTSETTVSNSYQGALDAQIPDKDFTDVQEIADTPVPPVPPKPEPEPEGSPEIPAVIEDLMEIDLEAVDPTELTPEQAEQLVEAALETFETATEGSPEYEQALDALYLAAQEDDIVLDEALAEIPGVGQAAQAVVAVLNIVGNVGADISPKARKKAQEVVVTTLVVGQIAQTAAIAQAGSGGSFRRKS